MRKLAIFAAIAVMAGASVVQAQNAPPGQPGRVGRGMGRRGGPGGMMDRVLLKNITLTDAQKASLAQLHQTEREKMQADSGRHGRADFDAIREARQKGDTATANQLMAEQRTKMEARRDEQIAAIRAILTGEQIAAIRAILTGDQIATFDANVVELKQRASEKGPGERGGRGGRGRRGTPPPRS